MFAHKGRRSVILQAAAAQLARQGYEATTIGGIAKAAQSSVGSVTNFFGSKAQLALAVRDSVAASLCDAVVAALEKHKLDVAKGIDGAIAAYLAWWTANPERSALLGDLAVVWVDGRRVDCSAMAKLSEAISKWAAPHMQAGSLPSHEPTHPLAGILGSAMALTATCGDERLRELEAPELAGHLAGQVLHGLWQKPACADTAPVELPVSRQKAPKKVNATRAEPDRQLAFAILDHPF